MISFINGEIVSLSDSGALVIDCGGLGYEMQVSLAACGHFKKGTRAKVYTYMNVKEDGVSLFGFYSTEEREMFKKLIGVSGVGPKVAMSLLSGMRLEALAGAIIAEDSASLSKIKGIGKKTAERVVLELKEQMYGMKFTDIPRGKTVTPVTEAAVLALCSLGLSRAEGQAAVELAKKSLNEGAGVEELIASALRHI